MNRLLLLAVVACPAITDAQLVSFVMKDDVVCKAP
jgi:hypothetical protein